MTSQLDCENSDSLTVNSGVVLNFNNNDAVNASNTDEVTIVNSGTIEHSVDEKQSVINGSATRNLTITNNGIINSTKKYCELILLLQFLHLPLRNINESKGTLSYHFILFLHDRQKDLFVITL